MCFCFSCPKYQKCYYLQHLGSVHCSVHCSVHWACTEFCTAHWQVDAYISSAMTSSSWKNLFLCIVGLEGFWVQLRCARTRVPTCFCDSNFFDIRTWFVVHTFANVLPQNRKCPLCRQKFFPVSGVNASGILTCFDIRTWISCIFCKSLTPNPKIAIVLKERFSNIRGKRWAI